VGETGIGPLITAVIPTYRRPMLLRRAIRSVLAQTYPHLRVCVYDNASGDETPSVVDEMARTDCRIKYYCHPENIGALKNFIYGMEQVETPFFSIFSDDDVLLPDFYQTALAGFEKFPEVMCSVTATLQVDCRGNILGIPLLAWKPGLYLPPEGLLAMLNCLPPVWTSVLFRREVIEKVGCLDEEVGPAADLDFELRTAARFPIVVSLQPGAMFVRHPGSSCTSPLLSFIWPGWLKMVRNLTEDQRIPYDARRYAGHVLTERLKSSLVRQGLGSLVRRNWEDTLKASEVLGNHYHLRGRARLLRVSARVCRHLPGVYYLFYALYALRMLLMRLKGRRWRKEYGAYARQLEL